MALDRRSVMTWLDTNLATVNPSFSEVSDPTHAAAVDTTRIYADTVSYVTDEDGNQPNIPFIGVWYDRELTAYQKHSHGIYKAEFSIAIGVYLRTGYVAQYSRQRAELQQIGEAWESALVTWYKANLTLGNNILATGDGTANYYSLPLTPLPPWSEVECYGALLVIPVTKLV